MGVEIDSGGECSLTQRDGPQPSALTKTGPRVDEDKEVVTKRPNFDSDHATGKSMCASMVSRDRPETHKSG